MNHENDPLEMDSGERRVLIKTTVILAAVLAFNILATGLLMLWLGRTNFSYVMLAGGGLFVANLALFGVWRNWRVFRFSIILSGFVLPIALHIVLGGYVHSGGIILWGILIILWAGVIEHGRVKYVWLAGYILAAVGLALMEGRVAAGSEPLSAGQQVLLMVNLLVSLTVGIFIVFDINQSKLKHEKKKSDELLLNILPHEVAQELKSTGATHPESYDSATVLFTDFKGFTQIAEHLSPEQVVQELHYCFKQFDLIARKYGIEKIKTIGDAYMCAGGLPSRNDSHPVDVVRAGIEMRDFIHAWRAEHIARGAPVWDVRIGIHTGKVVAGVVGLSKFAYDIWGDTVNTASRMESSGAPGKVNVSRDTYDLVRAHFTCTPRGAIAAKNKGEIEMFFVESATASG